MQSIETRQAKICDGSAVARALAPSVLSANPALVDQWQRLANGASTPNPFFEPWYLLPSLAALDPAGDVTLLAVEQGGALVGIIPIQPERRYDRYPLPHWRSWVHENCFNGAPLVAAGQEEAFWPAVLDWCDRHAGPRSFLHLSQMPLEGALIDALQAAANERTPRLVRREERALLQSHCAPEAYLEAALPTKKRKELRRQHRRLSEEGTLEFTRQSDAEGLEEWIAAFLALEAAGWKGQAQSALASAPATSRLFTEALHGAAQLGKLERLTLSLDQRPIAMLANFLTAPGAFSYKTTYDENLARFSPGVLLQLENLALLNRPDIDWCDSCAAPDHPMIDKLWRERRAIGRISIGIGSAAHRTAFRAISQFESGEPL